MWLLHMEQTDVAYYTREMGERFDYQNYRNTAWMVVVRKRET